MRIKGSERMASQRFWPSTMEWLGSRRGLGQFLLAFGVGLTLALFLGVIYKLVGWKIIEPPLLGLLTEVNDTADAVLVTNDLPDLFFDIGFEEFQTMVAQRDEALQTGVLLLDDADWMNAEIRYQNETIPVRVRLKGDWLDHLGENKWSFRVSTRNDTALMGMRSFSVQSPHTREFLLEWLFLEDLRKAGILAPRYTFVNVSVNGESWGVYALEESFSKELLESQGRREGIILRFDESLLWERRALYGGVQYDFDSFTASYNWTEFAGLDEFNTNEVKSDPVLMEQREAAFGLLRGFQNEQLTPSEVFDAEMMGRYLAHTNLWGADHALVWHNERYYYDPLTSRLEPIGYDAEPRLPNLARFPHLAQYDDLGVMRSYVQEIRHISQPGYLEQLQAEYEAEFARYRAALVEEFDPKFVQPPWELLAERQALLANTLNPPQTVYAYIASGNTDSSTEVLVGNILLYPVTLHEMRIGEQSAPIQPEWVQEPEPPLPHQEPAPPLLYQEAEPKVVLRSAPRDVPKFIRLRIPNSVIEALLPTDSTLYSNTLQIVTSPYGVENQVVVDAQWDYPPVAEVAYLPIQPSLKEALEQHPFLSLSEQPGFLKLEPGDWHVDGDLVLPAGVGLYATEAVKLAFDRDAILFSDSPLVLEGPTPGSISLLPKEDQWAGIIVLQAGEDRPSILHNVEIRATAGISRNGWITTGGVTFYESPVELSSSRVLDSLAEDAINVVRTGFDFRDTEFGNIASDAFDGDFANGRIERCAFHDVRGDGIDVSASEIFVDSVNLLRVHDKGISAGEGSTVEATGVHAVNVGIAIASKDMSSVIVQGGYIDRAWIAGLAAYLKKEEYGPASIRAKGIEFADGSRRALVQTDSSVVIDDEPASPVALDVPSLYNQLAALGQMQFLDYQFGPAIRLLGYALAPPEPSPNPEGSFRLHLYWQADTKPEADYTVFVHVVDDSGTIVAQKDGAPADDAFRTMFWEPGEVVNDLHIVPLPPDMPAGEYRVIIGLYDGQTRERLPVHLPSGENVPSGAIELEQTLVVGD